MKVPPADLIERAIAVDDWVRARKLIQHELKRDPKDHFWLSRLALTYYEQRQYRRALYFEGKAAQIAPYCPMVIWGYAGALDMLGHIREALQIYRWLLSRNEQDLAYGECGEGIGAARSLIADCHYRVALILEEMGQRKRALASYQEHLARRQHGARSIYPLRDVKARYKRLDAKK